MKGVEGRVRTGIAVIDDIKDRDPAPGRIPPFLPLPTPLGRPPQRPDRILHVHGVDPQILVPQPLHLLAQMLIHPRETQRRRHEFIAIIAIHMRQPQHHQIQAFDLTQLLFRRQLPLRHLEPRFRLVAFFPRRRVRLVDHARADFDEGGHFAFRGFAARGDGEVQGAEPVDFVVLRVARFAAAVEDVVELSAVLPVEDAWQGLWSRGGGGQFGRRGRG